MEIAFIIILAGALGVSLFFNWKLWRGLCLYRSAYNGTSKVLEKIAYVGGLILGAYIIKKLINQNDNDSN